MRAKTEDTLLKGGIIGAVVLVGYLLWSRAQAGTNTACNTLVGLPRLLCELGWQVTGGATCYPGEAELCTSIGGTFDNATCVCSGAAKPAPLERDSYGCLTATERWCPIDKKCMDNSMSCTPDPSLIPSPGACYEWSPDFHKWVYSPGLAGCVPYTEHPVIPSCAESECKPGVQMCVDGISKICVPLGAGCEDKGIWSQGGQACKIASNIVDCSCGKVDLNNPPGTTCETACPIAAGVDCQASIKDFEVCIAREGKIVNWCTDLAGNPLVAMLKKGYEPAEEYTGPGQFDNPNMKRCAWKKSGKASEAEFNVWAKSCRDAGNVASTYPTYPGYETLDSIDRAYTGGEFPGAGTIFCLKKVA